MGRLLGGRPGHARPALSVDLEALDPDQVARPVGWQNAIWQRKGFVEGAVTSEPEDGTTMTGQARYPALLPVPRQPVWAGLCFARLTLPLDPYRSKSVTSLVQHERWPDFETAVAPGAAARDLSQ